MNKVNSKETEHKYFSGDDDIDLPMKINSVGTITCSEDAATLLKTADGKFHMVYLINGNSIVTSGDDTFYPSSDDVVLLHPDKSYKVMIEKNQKTQVYAIMFESKFFSDLLEAYHLTDKTVFKNSGCSAQFKKIKQISETSTNNKVACYPVLTLLEEVMGLWAHNNLKQSPKLDIALRIKEYIDNSLFEKITIDEVANKFYMSKIQLLRLYKKYYGQTPYDYLLSIKIATAKHMLVYTELSVTEISGRLAFEDEHYFSRFFKKKTGLRPLEYRKKARGESFPPDN